MLLTVKCLKVVLVPQDPQGPAWLELLAFPDPRDLEAAPQVPLEPGAFQALQEAFRGALGASCPVGPLGPRLPVLLVVGAPASDSVARPPARMESTQDFIFIFRPRIIDTICFHFELSQ